MKEYHRAIFFTKIPLGGYYQYEDVFQLFPASMENLPKSSLQEHFPNILEYWTTDDEEIELKSDLDEFPRIKELYDRTSMKLLKEDRILALLSTFTNHLFFRYTTTTGSWGIPMLYDNPGDEANSWYSKWCVPLFNFPDLAQHFRIDKFSQPSVQEAIRIDHKYYYLHEPNIDSDPRKKIVFPSKIDSLFEIYFSLDPETKEFVDTACSYSVSAMKLNDEMKTLSLIASFTAVETMVNLEFKDAQIEKCDNCGQIKYSVAKKFREYLLKYIGKSDQNKKKFNTYYSLRSKIVHTGRQLKTERLFADVSKDEKVSEYLTRMEILQLGKLAIVNWLLIKTELNKCNSDISG